MKKLIVFSLLALGVILISSWSSTVNNVDTVSYRCLIQLTNYGGEGAYVITSLINPEGKYEQTLFVGGDDEEWYPDLPIWYEFYEKSSADIDGVTGASIKSGGRKVALLEVEANKLNNGYKLRFESSVEDGLYHEKDIEVDLTDNTFGKTIQGNGYIRYVRIITK
ncbi:MAG: DUF2271 domain-containing protein [Bacteroidota bacterium]